MTMFSRLALVALLALPSALLGGCGDSSSGSTNTTGVQGECTPGQTKKAADGCNTCACQQNGFYACTELACVGGGGSSGSSGGNSCQTSADCTGKGPKPDCVVVGCFEGTCEFQCDGTSNQCASSADCPSSCFTCNGNTECALGACVSGKCLQPSVPPCAPPSCDAQDAHGTHECDGILIFGYRWNGSQCEVVMGCSVSGCQGSDCGNLAKDKDTCQQEHATCPSTGGCSADSDCGETCQSCDGGSVCAQGSCLNGECSFPDFPPCAPPTATPGGACTQPGAQSPAADGCNTCTCGKNLTWSCTEIACASTCNSNADCVSVADPACINCPGLNDCGHTYCDTSEGLVGVCKTLPPTCGDSCAAQDVHSTGTCDEEHESFGWNGSACIALDCCGGTDCDKKYPDLSACQAVHQSCSPCTQDAKGVGMNCDGTTLFGYNWTGTSCEPVIGCSCEGKDCDKLAKTEQACQMIHLTCASNL